jgi:diacylglycerol kinase family enzyme
MDESGADRAPFKSQARKRRLEGLIKSERIAALVVNTRSRRGERLYAKARYLLGERGFKLDVCYAVSDPARQPGIVRSLIAGGHKLVIVGDGTVSAVAALFAYKDVVFGLLPLGTANSFARTLSIPLSVKGAVDVIADGEVVDIDLGKVNDDYFAITADLGLAPLVASATPYRLKRYLGSAGYLLIGDAKFLSHKPLQCTLTEEGIDLRVDATLDVLIAKGQYFGGTPVIEEAAVESRDLVILIVKGPTGSNLVKAWPRLESARRFVETVRGA